MNIMKAHSPPPPQSPLAPPSTNADDGDDYSGSSSSSSHWSIEFHPLLTRGEDNTKNNEHDHRQSSRPHPKHHHSSLTRNNFALSNEDMVLSVSIPLAQLFSRDLDAYQAFVPRSYHVSQYNEICVDDQDNNTDSSTVLRQASAARVALSDYTARCLADLLPFRSSNNKATSSSLNNEGTKTTDHDSNITSIIIQTMGQQSRHCKRKGITLLDGSKNRKNKMTPKKETPLPFVLERTDCMIVNVPQPQQLCDGGAPTTTTTTATTTTTLKFLLHAAFVTPASSSPSSWDEHKIRKILSPTLHQLHVRLTSTGCYQHVACVVLQRTLRSMLLPPKSTRPTAPKKQELHHQCYLNAIAFIADGSLLPRKSGRSMLPMPSPPSLPFVSPHSQQLQQQPQQQQQQQHEEEKDASRGSTESSQLTKIVTVHVGRFWRKFLNEDGSTRIAATTTAASTADTDISAGSETVTMRGMIIPCGVTLIVGGGYHGKSTLLQQALVMGVYDKIPGDGRERCVSHQDAVSIRAEDGRYVNNVNISAFISELPKIKPWGTSTSLVSSSSLSSGGDASHDHRNDNDVTCFGTKDASGSTSQAANVIEAIECGASALLVDEDVSAANFMARDGRMRAMIMNEPITPLLYRVNGLFVSKGISTVVVVGGVGDWLDVADAVVLMQDYVAYDGLKKARSVSYQFSYGHVQYAGRGVVHRLPWEVKDAAQKERSVPAEEGGVITTVSTLSPLRRRPESHYVTNKFNDVAMLDRSRLWFYQTDVGEVYGEFTCSDSVMESSGDDDDDDNDEDEGIVDMSKCSQLIDNSSEQLYGCGICVLWLILESQRHPGDDLLDLLIRMERELDSGGCDGGMNKLLSSLVESRKFACNEAANSLPRSSFVLDLWETVGYAYRPRRHEVAMALTRIRGMKFERLPEKPNEVAESLSPEEEAKLKEEDSKKRALAELWKNRRRK